LQEEGVAVVAAFEQHDEASGADTADSDDLDRDVERPEPVQEPAPVVAQARGVRPEIVEHARLNVLRMLVVGDFAQRDQQRRVRTDLVLAVDLHREFRERLQAVARTRLRLEPVEGVSGTWAVRDLFQPLQVLGREIGVPDLQVSHRGEASRYD
jgi:hypothetical protein